jgi:hypothetical protein
MNKHLRLAYMISDILDNRFKILGLRFGIEPLLGIIPGFGDFIGLVLSLYIVWIGTQMKLPADKTQRMITNVVFDFVIGLFPVIGDIADFAFKANAKNMEILREFAPDAVVEGKIL